MSWFKKGKGTPEEKRDGADRRKPNLLSRAVKASFRFFFITIIWGTLCFIGRLFKWSLMMTGVAAALVVGGILAIGFFPQIIDTFDGKYPEKLTAKLDLKDIAPLLASNYFAEESNVFVGGNKKVACFSSAEHRQIIDRIEDVPLFEHAIIASEDKSFYEHNGVDGWAILRAIGGHLENAFGLGGSKSGASTITMQLAKSLYKDKNGKDAPRTIRQKLREAVTAIRIEHHLNKHQIMQRYMNMPYLGRGQYGIEAASYAYFGKSAKELNADLPKVAFVVALINKPALPDRMTKGDPYPEETRKENLRRSIRGAQRVLDLMYEERDVTEITKIAYAQASVDLEKLKVFPIGNGCYGGDSGRYYTEHVRVENKDKFALNSGGYDIYLPRDDGLQDVLAKAVKLTVNTYLERHKSDLDNNELRACAYAIQFDGNVLAWVGNVDFKKYKFDACALGWRSPGSTIKPFTYMALVQKLVDETIAAEHPPETIDEIVRQVLAKCNVLDAPIGVSLGRGRGVKMIQNFHSRSEPLYRGNISCQLGLGESRNAAAMRAGQRGGIKEMIKLIYLLGMPQDAKHIQQPYPTTAIGGSDVRPIGMAGLASLPNGGFKVTPRFTYDICKDGKSALFTEEDGSPRDCDKKGDHRDMPERMIHPAVSAAMTELIKGPVDLPTGTVHSLRRGVIPGMDPLSSAIWQLKPKEKEAIMLKFPIEEAGELGGKTGTATNADGRTSDVWLLLFVPGPTDDPGKGIMLVFWMGKDSKDHPLGERGTTGGAGFAESGGRNWSHSAATVLKFLQKERGLLQPGNHFQPMIRDDVLLDFDAKRFSSPQQDVISDPDGPQIIDPSDPGTPIELLDQVPKEEPGEPPVSPPVQNEGKDPPLPPDGLHD
jgi:penicillin-binding protein 1A